MTTPATSSFADKFKGQAHDIGEAFGGLGGLFGGGGGGGYKTRRIPNFTPEQMNLLNQLLSGVSGGIGGGLGQLAGLASGDVSSFAPYEQNALNQFNQQIIPGIAQRFGNQGTLNSSLFANAASGAGANLASMLGARRQQIQYQAIRDLLGLGENLLGQRPYENVLEPTNDFDVGGAIGGVGKLAASIIPLFL